jgi:Rhodopirellula transposase DDE domain
MEPSPSMCAWLVETANSFHGAQRRHFMAQTVEALELSQRQAALLLGWARDTVRKGLHELHSGITCLDNFSARGRKPVEVRLPSLLDDIRDLIHDHLQTDPTFQTTRLYCRISAAEVRKQLIDRKGYPAKQVPSIPTITTKLNQLGFRLRPVTKCKPQKKLKETDAIFQQLSKVHQQAAQSTDTLRLSLDSKAPVLIGPFSRGGKSRLGTVGADHDFKPSGRLTPFGLFLPDSKELNLYFTSSKVTSDFMVDRLGEWWAENQARFPRVERLLLDLDNGPENHSRRSQFVYRLVQLAQKERLTIELVYYPPYHSKYNSIERCWGVLEVYWNGELLDSEAAVLGFARSMTYGGKHPQVSRVSQTYASGVCRSTKEMKRLEQCLQRLPGLEKWSVIIPPPKVDELFS